MGKGAVYSFGLAKLSLAELSVYSVLMFATWIYGFYVIAKESSRIKDLYYHSTGSRLLGFNVEKDNTDLEWNAFLGRFFTKSFVLYLALIPLIDHLAKKLAFKYHKLIMIAYSAAISVRFFKLSGLLILFGLNLLTYSLTCFKQKILIWAVLIGAMRLGDLTNALSFLTNDESYDEFIAVWFFMILRVIGFCMDKIDVAKAQASANSTDSSKSTKEKANMKRDLKDYSLVNFIFYAHYPSFAFISHFVPFDRFRTCEDFQVNSSNWKGLVRDAVKTILRVALAILIIEFLLRTTCFNLISNHLSLLDRTGAVPSHVYKVASILKVFVFGFKYTVFYGVTYLVNNLVGMTTTALPKCVAMIHTSKELWRYFDTGLYEFIKRYLYIPFGGNRQEVHKHVVSLLLSFAFIYYWHGLSMKILVWTSINFSTLVTEIFLLRFLNSQRCPEIDISPRLKRTLVCIAISIWQMVHFYANITFLTSVDACKHLLFKSITINGANLISMMPLLFGFYLNAQMRLEFVELQI